MKPITDLDGSIIPTPGPTSDAAEAAWFLLFCRRNHFQLRGGVRIGAVQVQEVIDLDQPGKAGPMDLGAWAAAGFSQE